MNTASEKDNVLKVIRIVLSQSVSATMTGSNTFNITFFLPEDVLIALLNFMTSHGYQPEEAISAFERLKQEQIQSVRSTVSRSGQGYSPSSSDSPYLYLIPLGILLVFGFLAVAGFLPIWTISLASLFCFPLLWLMWSPQNKMLNNHWCSNEKPAEEKLENMLKAIQESSFAYALRTKKTQFIALAAAFFLCTALPLGVSAGLAIDASNYHSAIIADGEPLKITDSTGDKFVLYNDDTGRYFRDSYLPKAYQAQSTDEVAGVLTVYTEERKVGTYGSTGNAYKYYITISLYDCTTGELVDSTRISGGEPPETIRTRGFQIFTGKDGYGSKPTDKEMEAACMRLIKSYQASR